MFAMRPIHNITYDYTTLMIVQTARKSDSILRHAYANIIEAYCLDFCYDLFRNLFNICNKFSLLAMVLNSE